ncbi:hypothetical protein [uncultured Sphingomonas sp.]|nr:hypothetical protein [uncultured Sphingomonas sp.]
MRNPSNRTFTQSLASMAAALLVSLFVLGATTASGPSAVTLAAPRIA